MVRSGLAYILVSILDTMIMPGLEGTSVSRLDIILDRVDIDMIRSELVGLSVQRLDTMINTGLAGASVSRLDTMISSG